MYVYTSQGARAEAVPVSGRGCPDLGTLPDVTVTELYKGGILQFTCPEGMRREGPQKLMCDGTNWDQEPPRCLCKFTGLSIVFRPLCLCRFGCPQFSSGRSVSVTSTSWAVRFLPFLFVIWVVRSLSCLSMCHYFGLSVLFPFCLSFGLSVLFPFCLSFGLSVLFPVFLIVSWVVRSLPCL